VELTIEARDDLELRAENIDLSQGAANQCNFGAVDPCHEHSLFDRLRKLGRHSVCTSDRSTGLPCVPGEAVSTGQLCPEFVMETHNQVQRGKIRT
jgi:hypothetical protein